MVVPTLHLPSLSSALFQATFSLLFHFSVHICFQLSGARATSQGHSRNLTVISATHVEMPCELSESAEDDDGDRDLKPQRAIHYSGTQDPRATEYKIISGIQDAV